MGNNKSIPSLRLVDDVFFKQQETSQEWKQIRRQRLVNSLNRINFQDGEIFLNFKHPQYKYTLSLPVKPQPCSDENLNCTWGESIEYNKRIQDFEFKDFHFTDGLKKILVEAELLNITKDSVQFSLPEICDEVRTRRVRRYQCNNVSAQLSQDGIVLEGSLTTFSAVSFSVYFPKGSPNYHNDLNREDYVNVVLSKDSVPHYSGICEILRIASNPDGKIIILIPIKSQIQRFRAKKHRSIRQMLLPSPNIIFKHPLTDKIVNLKALDISGAGFSVKEDIENSMLIPGLVIHDLSIETMNGTELKCKAQLIYRNIEDAKHLKCGLAYLDMDIRHQIGLSSLLHQANNKHAYVCTKIDVNDLWDFFFETGFIYPQKYSFIGKYKKEFNRIYKKLYEDNPEIAINFIHKENGSILAHMSMFRFYDKTWIINHHAAMSSRNNKAGLAVLEQISCYINDFYRLASTNMKYVACYFRPENKFPNIVFGGVVKKASDLKSCSADQFAYLYIDKSKNKRKLTTDWSLEKISSEDLYALHCFYEKRSGGLTLKAMDLYPYQTSNDDSINKSYRELGFKRGKHLFSLKKEDELFAVFVVNISDLGLNMSDLTNCIQIFVLEPSLPYSTVEATLSELSSYYKHDKTPALIFPYYYVKENSIPIEKSYNFWVLDVHRIGDRYFDHLERLLRYTR
jgi:hypothetical protein